MQSIGGDPQICHTVLRGKQNEHLFEEEIRKMKLLSMTADVRRKMDIQVLAYCVLDNELHMILQLREGQSADQFLDDIARRYEQLCMTDNVLRVDYLSGQSKYPDVNSSVREQGFFYGANQKIKHFRKNTVQFLNGSSAALRGCLKLHMMPVRLGIASAPGDYWWCSYLDYTGRNWLQIADTSEILENLSPNPKLAQKSIRMYHQKELEKIVPTN